MQQTALKTSSEEETATPLPRTLPPHGRRNILTRLRESFFSSPLNALLTLGSLYLLAAIVPPVVDWLVLDATFAGSSRDDCRMEGACWVFVKVRIVQFIYGFYPQDSLWRVNVALAIPAIGIALLLLPGVPRKGAIGAFLLLAYPAIALVLLVGGVPGLVHVPTHFWGGLMLTLVIAGFGIVLSLPIGVMMALGRRSDLPIIRGLSIAFIEFIRGVPLITILFMASVMLPLFTPEGVNIDKVLRAMLGVAIFWAAAMAEVVRGGLQAIPKGQYEAAQSLGLGYWQTMGLCILPQALKHAIPGIVGVFISLFKDTTLVLIIGVFDLLGIIQAAAADPKWIGHYKEGYVFAALCFGVFCFSMSRYSQSLEKKLARGQ